MSEIGSVLRRFEELRWRIRLSREAFPNLAYVTYVAELRKVLQGCQTLLDLGCGAKSPTRHLEFDRSVGVDGHEPYVVLARARGTHDEVHLRDFKDLADVFEPGEFDSCVALDVIEHLTKEDGDRFLGDIERIAARKVVIFTPNGFLSQLSSETHLQEHRSGWTPDEMRDRGYRVLGVYGHQSLRGQGHRLRLQPRILGGLVSEFSQYGWVRNHPESAAALLCVKSLRSTSD